MQSSHIPTLDTVTGDRECENQVDSGELLDLDLPSGASSSSSTNDFMMEDLETLYKYSHRGSGAAHKQTTLHSFVSKRPRTSGTQDHPLYMVDTSRSDMDVTVSRGLLSSKSESIDTRGTTGKTSSIVTNSYEYVEEMVVETKAATLSAKGTRKNVASHQSESLLAFPAAGSQAKKNGAQKRPRKLCPFYKKVPGTGFTVDAFKYGSIPDCTGYFLSHFHSDHYQGLSRRFEGTLYCTEVTGNLVIQQLKVPSSCVHTLSLNVPSVINGVQVTFLEANHCPGAVLLLFKLVSGRTYLHTGDFRFCSSMLDYPELKGITVHELYLDTTYCNPKYDFPKQDEVISFAVSKSIEAIQKNPNTLIICGTYTIGKEKVFRAIAETLGIKVCVKADKKAILDCLVCDWLAQNIHTDPRSTNLHVLPIGKLSMTSLESYLEQWGSKYTALIAFKPTGWTYGRQGGSLASIRPHVSGPITIYGIPYSEHSSFTELKEFVQFLRPYKIIPTVDNFSANRREEMQRTFQEWLSGSGPVPAKRQVTLDTFKHTLS